MSLFLKIFLWFWLALGLIGAVLFVTAEMTQSQPLAVHWQYMTANAMGVYAETAAGLYEREGGPALVLYLEKVERVSHIRAVLYNSRGEELSGRGAPAGAREVATRAQISDAPEFEFSLARTLAARRAAAAGGGETYVLVGEIPSGRFAALRTRDPSALLLRLIALLATSGVVCYALARYLALPVEKLRSGVRRLARGDLSIRVAPRLGTRRDELADLGRDFDSMAERIESLVLAQQRLLGDISHELRSPLARMGVALELARQRAGAEAAPALDRIGREADRLNELIGQLLMLTRLEADAQEPRQAEVELARLVREIAQDADYEARGHGRGVRVAECEECVVFGSEELLRRAVENVVRNAARYTAPATEVEIALRCEQVESGRAAVIRVRDHGEGVPEETLADLFRPFYRVADARDRQTGGTGLGLAITERAVRLHGGTVRAANAAGGGLLIEISLPAVGPSRHQSEKK